MSGLSKASATPNEFCQKVRDSILSLGDNADAIANTLASKGCQGTKGDGHHCPIARYLQTEFSTFVDDDDILVSEDFIEVDDCTFYKHQSADDAGIIDVEEDHFLEDFVWEFVTGFDSGKYPDLVDPNRPINSIEDLDDEEYDLDWDDDDLDDEEDDDDDDENLDDFNDDEDEDDEDDDDKEF
jgi:hypothetical protein